MSNLYVYGVISTDGSDREFDLEADAVGGGDRIYTISHRRFAAIVSDIETTEPEQTDEDATRHDEVLREIMVGSESDDTADDEDGETIIPMQFGMVFESKRALKNVLRGARAAFRRTMRDIEGAVELGLKLVRDEDADVDTEAVEAAVGDALEPLAEESVANDLFSDRLVLNRSYLVDRENREAFDEAVAELEAEYEELSFQYSGPFAPYNFVDVHIGAQ